jgi:hypothetical protein
MVYSTILCQFDRVIYKGLRLLVFRSPDFFDLYFLLWTHYIQAQFCLHYFTARKRSVPKFLGNWCNFKFLNATHISLSVSVFRLLIKFLLALKLYILK